nr:MAG TPA: hypothetical protein [Caudoviricetes sp.]
MKISENGVIREMTAAEIAELQESSMAAESTIEPLTDEKKLKLMLATIPEEPMPTVEPKVGYRWKPMYTPSSGFAWELVEDPTALGTMKNPLYWLPGKAVKMGYHYTDGTTKYVALADGVPSGFDDATYFAEV